MPDIYVTLTSVRRDPSDNNGIGLGYPESTQRAIPCLSLSRLVKSLVVTRNRLRTKR